MASERSEINWTMVTTEIWLWSQHAKKKLLKKCWGERLLAHAPSATLHNDDKICNVDPVAKYFRCYIISYKYIKHDAEENAALIRWYTRCIKILYKKKIYTIESSYNFYPIEKMWRKMVDVNYATTLQWQIHSHTVE